MQSLYIKPYHKGLVDPGRGGYTWLGPDGDWSWSNARPITDGDHAHGSQRMITALMDRSPTIANDTTVSFGLPAKLDQSRHY